MTGSHSSWVEKSPPVISRERSSASVGRGKRDDMATNPARCPSPSYAALPQQPNFRIPTAPHHYSGNPPLTQEQTQRLWLSGRQRPPGCDRISASCLIEPRLRRTTARRLADLERSRRTSTPRAN